MRIGLYKGDLGIVTHTADQSTSLLVKLVPRLDLSAIEAKQVFFFSFFFSIYKFHVESKSFRRIWGSKTQKSGEIVRLMELNKDTTGPRTTCTY